MSDLAKKALELAGAASPAPWKITETPEIDCGYSRSSRGIVSANGEPVVIGDPSESEYAEAIDLDGADAAFIAFSREALPALAEEVMRLREALKYAEQAMLGVCEAFADMDIRVPPALKTEIARVRAALASKPEKE